MRGTMRTSTCFESDSIRPLLQNIRASYVGEIVNLKLKNLNRLLFNRFRFSILPSSNGHTENNVFHPCVQVGSGLLLL